MKKDNKILIVIGILMILFSLIILLYGLFDLKEPETGCSTNSDCGYGLDICYKGQCISGSQRCKQVLYSDFPERVSLSVNEPDCFSFFNHCRCDITLENPVYQELNNSRVLIQSGKYDKVFFDLK